ncbi:8537_t:CDS:2 [Entrophospora sp. SA101]|nr:8949_t:CDS:2 [Entrophospora sp. SA101]CAJ0879533.1 8537_t:CDS:2 [Entrophospora sp. SA101]
MDPKPLPPGWISQFDPNSNSYYYVDKTTGITQWHHPLATPSSNTTSTTSGVSGFPTADPYPAQPQPQNLEYPISPATTSIKSPPSSISSPQSFHQFPQPSNYPPTTQQYYDASGDKKDKQGNKHGEQDKGLLGKAALGLGAGAVGGLLLNNAMKHQFGHKHKYKHKGWKGKGWKGWKGKGWKGKGWK